METKFGFRWFTSTPIDYELLLWILVCVAAVALLATYISYRYQRWKQFREFEDEMRLLDLEPEQEGTLGAMVRRHQVGEPVQVLYSAKKFDDLATSEMRRILASQGSAESKENIIDMIYEIRTRTYHPEWLDQVRRSGKTSRGDRPYGTGEGLRAGSR